MQKSVLVTGGAGFIGSHLVDRLVETGYQVRVIDDLSTGNLRNIKKENAEKIDFIKGDIRDSSLLRSGLQGVNTVVHLAALTSVPYSVENPDLTFDVNTEATLNLVKLSEAASVSKFVFASSCAVYGDSKTLPINENAVPAPLSPYAESKLQAERHCLGSKTLASIVLRFFNVYGPRQGLSEYSGVITRFSEDIKRKKPLTIYGNGSQTRDFVYVSDIVDVLLASIKNKTINEQIFNVGVGRPTSINELAKTMLDLLDSDLSITYEKPRNGDIKDSFADISKAKKFLEYQPYFSLRDGLTAFLKPQTITIFTRNK